MSSACHCVIHVDPKRLRLLLGVGAAFKSAVSPVEVEVTERPPCPRCRAPTETL